MSKPSITVDGLTGIISATINESHDSAVSIATLECETLTKDIGDSIEIYLGYDGSTERKFSGYIKQIEKKVPDNTYTITANDVMTRAIDYFIASDNPNTPYSVQNIEAEDLVRNLLAMAGLTDYVYTQSYFTFAVSTEPVEINLVSVYDISKMVADTITWSIWADKDGQSHFESRKPFVMYGTSGMPGDKVDVPIAYSPTYGDILDINYTISEKNLRNRIVVYGKNVSATASTPSPYLPSGFYKSAVMSAGILIDRQDIAQQAADINLFYTNRLTESVSLTVVGSKDVNARDVVDLNITQMGLSGYWYVFGCSQEFGTNGYVTRLELRK